MSEVPSTVSIIIADDDVDDQLMIREALEEARVSNPIVVVSDGRELLDFLQKEIAGGASTQSFLILLDLNMPGMDGREALAEMKADNRLKRVPVVVLTTSDAEEDIFNTYDLGVSSFVVKPLTFDKLVEVMEKLTSYWLQVVQIPTV